MVPRPSDAACRWTDQTLNLRIQVQPRASRDEWLGRHGSVFRVRITAPPVDGKANSHLIRFLADLFGVPKSRVNLQSGVTGRIKQLTIQQPSHLPADIPTPG